MPWQPQHERRIAVMTLWAFFGSFGLAFVLSGFRGEDVLAGLAGFVIIAAAYGAHVIANHVFGTRFTKGEVALGFVVYALSLASFVLSWITLPGFGLVNIAIGLAGFGLLLAAFVFYMIANHGVRGSIDMIDSIRNVGVRSVRSTLPAPVALHAQLPRAPSERGLQSGAGPRPAGHTYKHTTSRRQAKAVLRRSRGVER